MVPRAGIEPAPPNGDKILSLAAAYIWRAFRPIEMVEIYHRRFSSTNRRHLATRLKVFFCRDDMVATLIKVAAAVTEESRVALLRRAIRPAIERLNVMASSVDLTPGILIDVAEAGIVIAPTGVHLLQRASQVLTLNHQAPDRTALVLDHLIDPLDLLHRGTLIHSFLPYCSAIVLAVSLTRRATRQARQSVP